MVRTVICLLVNGLKVDKDQEDSKLTRKITANSKIISQSLRRLRGNLRAPELSDVGVCSGPAGHCIASNPNELDVIGVRDVERVVASLGSKEIESVVQNKIAAINGVIAIYIDVVSILIVGFSNVCGVISKPRRDLLVSLGDEGGVAVGCLAA